MLDLLFSGCATVAAFGTLGLLIIHSRPSGHPRVEWDEPVA